MNKINQDPILAMLDAAPIDDEPLTDDDRRHIEEGWEAYRNGQVFSAEEIKRVCLDAKSDKRSLETKRAAPV